MSRSELLRASLVFLNLVLIGVLLPGCIVGKAQLTSEGILDKACTITLGSDSYRYRLEMSQYYADQGLFEESTTGEFVSPDKLHRVRETSRLIGDKESAEDDDWSWVVASEGIFEFVDIGSKRYSRSRQCNYTGGVPQEVEEGWTGWERGNTGLNLPLGQNGECIEFWCSLIDPVQLPDEEINGVLCLHYEGKGDPDKYMAFHQPVFLRHPDTGEFIDPETGPELERRWIEWHRQMDSTIEIWIGKDDYRLRQVKVEEENWFPYNIGTCGPDNHPCSDEELPPRLYAIPGCPYYTCTQIIQFYDYNKSIKIEPPI